MNPFTYTRPTATGDALALLAQADDGSTTRCIAGGTNLIDLMKEAAMQPARLVDINALPLATIEALPGGGLRLGALARNADTAYDERVQRQYPVISAAILAGASPQIRNMASNGGNLLQRTRCLYFYDVAVPCNKRQPGSGCPARTGLARQHAILGASTQCIATHPSDLCVALRALDAVVQVRSAARGARSIAFADFHRLPGDTPQRDTTLADDELIEAIDLPDASAYAAHSCYLKLRERASYAFALVSCAALLALGDDGRIRSARIALGGVAHKPWRVEAAEAVLTGAAPDDRTALESAARAVLDGAQAAGQGEDGSNAFKLPMAQRAIVRALELAARGTPTHFGNADPITLGDAA